MIEEILAELERFRGYFPREALEKAVEHREAITPALLHIIEDTTERVEELSTESDHMAHMYAMYLLAQFREPRACRPIAKFFSLPERVVDDLTGDLVTDDLHRIFGSICGRDDAILKRLIQDENISAYVRGAALRTMVVLLANGQKSRAELVAYFRSLFHGGLERTYCVVWAELVSACVEIHPEEFRKEIALCFAEGLVDALFVTSEEVHEALAEDKQIRLEALKQNQYYTLIDDTIAELEEWAWFRPEPDYSELSPPSQQDVKKMIKEWDEELRLIEEFSGRSASEETYKQYVPKPKIGRNEPCPCGSGKKYKKCCGNPALQER